MSRITRGGEFIMMNYNVFKLSMVCLIFLCGCGLNPQWIFSKRDYGHRCVGPYYIEKINGKDYVEVNVQSSDDDGEIIIDCLRSCP